MRFLKRLFWKASPTSARTRRGAKNRPDATHRLTPPDESLPWPLALPLFFWNEREAFRLSDAVCGVQAFGATGSGKSSGSIATILRAYMRSQMGMLILTVKPDDTQTYLGLCAQTGRLKDVILFGPTHEATFNFIAEAALGGAGLVGNLSSMLSVVSKIALGGDAASSGQDGGFWVRMETRLISSCADLLIRAGEPVTTANLERLATSLPSTREQVGETAWQERSFVYSCLHRAEQRATPGDSEEVRRLASYFLLELAELSPRTRGTVQSSVTSLLDLFNRQQVRRLLSSSEPNFDMTMLQEGKILIVDMPVLVHQNLARLVQGTLKYAFQLAQSRRDTSVNPRPVGLVSDESHLIVDLEHDAAFQTTARSTRTCTLLATQSISNYLSEQGGSGQVEARVHALLSNLQCQIFHQSTDTKTVEYAQALFGKRKHLLMNGGSSQQAENRVATALGLNSASSSNAGFSEHLDHMLQASDFHDLAKGGPQSDFAVEAILYQGGKTFSTTNRPYLPVAFQQRPAAD